MDRFIRLNACDSKNKGWRTNIVFNLNKLQLVIEDKEIIDDYEYVCYIRVEGYDFLWYLDKENYNKLLSYINIHIEN